ncbi:translocation/assembly module TamB domain-containing protein [Lewinella sp. LCG006]|uniref:translocation/assembly module TamB domain-containing protein n=1 Tax=Lewinella sp. LCG006 TaxID=3231911 RepID=UPI003460AFAB
MRKGIKWLLKAAMWLLLTLVSLIGIVVVALHTPPVQKWATEQAASFLEQTLQTEVGIGGFGLGVPRLLQLHDVFINTPQGDTLARLGHLKLGLDMWALLRQEISVDNVLLEDVYARIITTDSTSNFQFIIDAFAPVDTTAVKPAAEPAGSSGWTFNLQQTQLNLQGIDLYYQDDPGGLLLDVKLENGVLIADAIDLEKQSFLLERLFLQQAKVKVVLGQTEPSPVDTTAAAAIIAACQDLLLDEVDFSLSMDSLDMQTAFAALQVRELRTTLGETTAASFTDLTMRGGSITYDTPAPAAKGGFDANHLAIRQINGELSAFDFSGTQLVAKILELQGQDQSGLQLNHLSGDITYDSIALVVENLVLDTEQSSLNATLFRYGFPEDSLSNNLDLTARAQGDLAISELLKLLPDSLTSPWLQDYPGSKISFVTNLSSEGEQLNIGQLDVQAPGVDLRAKGEVYRPLDPEQIGGQLTLDRFQVEPDKVRVLLPPDLLPDYIEWPRLVSAQGRVSYLNQNLSLNLRAREERLTTPLWTQFLLQGKILKPADFKQATFDVFMDTLFVTRQSIQAYLPPKALPEGYQIPDYLEASGSVSGPMNNLVVDLQLFLPGRETYLKVGGKVKEVLDPEALFLDLKLADLNVRTADVLPLLPDSLLSPDFNLPNLRIQNASLTGKLDDLAFNLPINTSNGNGNVSGIYKPKDFSLDLDLFDTELAELFTGAIHDTIASLELQPLRMEIQAVGSLEPTFTASIHTRLTEEERGQLLDLNAEISENDYRAQLVFSHPYLQGTGEGRYQLQDSTALVRANFDLNKIDLERWQLSDRPLLGSGKLEVNSIGLKADQLDARILLDNILLRGEGSTAYIDSMLILANLNQEENQVTINSDVLQARLTGVFDPLKIMPEIVRFLTSYLDEEPFAGDPVINGQNFELEMELTNPRPFTSGIIPGLTELSPFSVDFSYRDKEPALLFDLQLGQLSYGGIRLEGMAIKAEGDEQQLALNGDWRNIVIGEDIAIGRTSIVSKQIQGGLNTTLKVFAQDSVRHRFSFNWRQTTRGQEISLEPRQVINFSEWRLPEGNAIVILDSTLTVEDWVMSRNDRSIRMEDTEQNGLAISFDDVNLARFSRLLNSEEALLGGIMNGNVYLDEVLTNLGIRADLGIAQLAYYEQAMGDFAVAVSSTDNTNFEMSASLNGAGNDLSVRGTYREGGVLDLQLAMKQLQVASVEPFSLGYLKNAEGYLEGNLAVTGTINEPRIDGQVSFQDAALAISLLGSRYRLDDQTIRFNGKTMLFEQFTLLDENNNNATLDGRVIVNSLEDIQLDLQARTKDFLAVNSTEKDNDLFYGYLRVDAEVSITGTAAEPRLVVAAAPSSESNLTYAYSTGDQARLETTQGVIKFAETYEWEEIIANEQRDTLTKSGSGAYLETNLQINEKLRIRVIIDPITQQEFSGRGNGTMTFIQYPTGQQQLTGQIRMAGGAYDMVLEGLQTYTFDLQAGSEVIFTGNPFNPQFDLTITNTVKVSPLPLVSSVTSGVADQTALRQRQTFLVALDLKGDLQGMDINADILYPEDIYGNQNLDAVKDALSQLRSDQSRVYLTAIMLITFKSFVIPKLDVGGNPQENIVNGVAGAVGDALSQLVNSQLGFVDFNLGVENYETSTGEQNYNLRLSLQKSFFNDRLIVSVDGVTNTAADTGTTEGDAQTYIDNVSVAYLLDPDGNLRIKLFNDRDRNEFVGGNTIRFGGRLVFSKDFNRFFWQKK